MKLLSSAPRGVFRGSNFMTPSVIGYAQGTYNGRTIWMELSRGTGISQQPIFGVTFRNCDGSNVEKNYKDDPSSVFQTESSAAEYMKQFTGVMCFKPII